MEGKLIFLTILMTLTLTGYAALAAKHAVSIEIEAHRIHVEQGRADLRQ